MKYPRLSFPWLSVLLLMVLCGYLYLLAQPSLANFYRLPEGLFEWPLPLVMMASVFLLVWVEVRRFCGRQQRLLRAMAAMEEQVAGLKESKKQLQNKAHSYSNQTEKLKLFISDRLLEYIEYDEKFLHFKGIAAEVRHNGIICYDQLVMALQHARDQAAEQPLYPQALTSLNYLWDLLDLSTADNIALHINNQLCECEEYYYQAQLQREQAGPEAAQQAPSELPYRPTFMAQDAVLRALRPLMAETELDAIIEREDSLCSGEAGGGFRYQLEKGCELLGNENHLVLVVENLVKNGLFYSARAVASSPAAKRYQQVALRLSRQEGRMRLSVFNPGPPIDEAKAEQIYQLGYTTRRARDQHGRGLGLYFVKEIVNGYEGALGHHNVEHRDDSYSIRIEFEGSGFSGAEVVTELVEVGLDGDHKLSCRLSSGEEESVTRILEWKRGRAIRSVEITARSSGQTHAFTDFSLNETVRGLDPEHPQIPRWALEVQARKRSSKISFIPLDSEGVCFEVSLPLADRQFEYDEAEASLSDTYLSRIEERYRSIER
ncbi:ATP-binding protein [Aestuariirhabdus litorea]|uniref:histidine kinase n=1 Tax=Aestuariirhabdus litorea TaxID=2528527 RepID=A0A3P3VQB7_9GAMM|nr:ATP-binding protein [Aestuariirhabdus litorea]RRJ83013.1 sensor histidine kinase [Aestuariirhabdus litorea]RWW93171.1 sensor histidine kinase [Endozoicomonadaceae bacterium GTF-13]